MQILILASLIIALLGTGVHEEHRHLDLAINAGPGTCGLVTLLTATGAALAFVGYNRLVARRVDRTGELNRKRYRRRLAMLGWLMLALFAVQVFVLNWPGFPLDWLRLARVPVLAELAVWAPFLAMLLAFWAAAYTVDLRLRTLDLHRRLQAALPVYADGIGCQGSTGSPGSRAAGFWSLRQFLGFQIRFHLLLILVPLMAILVAKTVLTEAFDRLDPWLKQQNVTEGHREGIFAAMMFTTAVCVLVFCPPLLARVFSTRPLPAGRLRDLLTAAMGRHGARVRRVLLWNTHGMVSNAAVMGPWHRLRYVMISDALVETLADEQIEGVFGHELGHVVHHHLIYLLMLVIALTAWGGWIVDNIATRLLKSLRPLLARWPDLADPFVAVLAGVTVLAGVLAFGWVSRRFERQADLAGAQTILLDRLRDSPFLPAAPSPAAADPSAPPHPGAAEVYVSALVRIADLNGLDPTQRTWRHGSIASRCDHLRGLLRADRFRRFQLTITLIKLTIVALVAGAVVLLSAN